MKTDFATTPVTFPPRLAAQTKDKARTPESVAHRTVDGEPWIPTWDHGTYATAYSSLLENR